METCSVTLRDVTVHVGVKVKEEVGAEGGVDGWRKKCTIFMKHCQVNIMQHLLVQ